MARKKATPRRRSYRRGDTYLKANLYGVGGYLLYRSFLVPMLPQAVQDSLALVEVGAGYVLKGKRGILGDTAKVMGTLGLVQLGQNLIPQLNMSSAGNSSSAY